MTTDEYMCGACGYIATSPTVMVQHYRAAHAETGVVPPAVANIGGITPAERVTEAAQRITPDLVAELPREVLERCAKALRRAADVAQWEMTRG